MTALGFRPFDADNHYYEATDAFTRHIPKDMERRCMQWVELGGKQRLLVGGKVNNFIPNPTFDPVSKPGALNQYFRGKVAGADLRTMFGDLDPIPAAYRDRDARLALMDQQGLDGAFFFPTLGVGMEESLRHDVPALLRRVPSVQPLVGRRLGLCLSRPDLRCAVHHARRPRVGGRRSCSGPSVVACG